MRDMIGNYISKHPLQLLFNKPFVLPYMHNLENTGYIWKVRIMNDCSIYYWRYSLCGLQLQEPYRSWKSLEDICAVRWKRPCCKCAFVKNSIMSLLACFFQREISIVLVKNKYMWRSENVLFFVSYVDCAIFSWMLQCFPVNSFQNVLTLHTAVSSVNTSELWVNGDEEFLLCANIQLEILTEIGPEGVNVTYELASDSAMYEEGNLDLYV